MIERAGIDKGTFRIRSTGYSGKTKQSIVATYKQASFLDYVYFTQLETSDPVSYGFANPSSALRAPTPSAAVPAGGTQSSPSRTPAAGDCDQIVFVSGDEIDGPAAHQRRAADLRQPSFGRSSADVIEVSAPPDGVVRGLRRRRQPRLHRPVRHERAGADPAATNGELRNIAGPPATYTGQTTISLSGNHMTITNGGSTIGPLAFPSNGVVYVENGTGCTSNYSPFTATYPPTSGCGNAVVRASGDYTEPAHDRGGERHHHRGRHHPHGQRPRSAWSRTTSSGSSTRSARRATSAAANGTITAQTGAGQLQQRRERHRLPVEPAHRRRDPRDRPLVHRRPLRLRRLARRARGERRDRPEVPRGRRHHRRHGYLKDYNYDDRLRYLEPPHFFDPVEAAWHVQRETLDFP